MLSAQDKRIIKELQNGLPLASRPYQIMAARLKMPEEELINRIRYLKENGIVRRLGAAVRHQDLGFKANAMVVWDVPDDKICAAGGLMAEFKEVTHCYQRPRQLAGHITFLPWYMAIPMRNVLRLLKRLPGMLE